QENFISSIVRTSNNHILLFWFNDYSKKLFMSRSTDNGDTWIHKQQILSGYTFLPDTVFELNSITDNNSNIILEFKLKQGLDHHFYSISTNNGINWSSPVILNFSSGLNNTRALNSSLGKLSNGTVVFCYNFHSANQPNPKGIYISRFANNSWTPNQIIDSTGTWGFVFSPSANQEMVVFVDSNGNKTDLYFRTSTDLGNTWSARQILLSTANSKSRPRVIKNDNGEIYIFYEELLPTSFNNFYISF
ncbi:MAG: glycoside hydrolase, partial [Gorillibacterium sp.]|nr:glycoside hydrolase [Gorillibacterium sp.]